MRVMKAFGRIGIAASVLAVAMLAAGCTTIKDRRGYIAEELLTDSIQPGLDNQQSVEGTLGRPTFTSHYGQPTWYYISSETHRKPFLSPKIREHSVLAVHFDAAGNVSAVETSGIDQIVRLDPEGDKTPTLGRERGFLQDLFGNIGAVGAPGAAPGS
jgi:outer membrane protein assembly factor BamE (lipoprotein component of BamABCDE complex)